MRRKGKLKTWNDDKGFGFIQPNLGEKQVFIHIKSFKNRNCRPEVGQIITYSLSSDTQGRPCAENATLPDNSFSMTQKKKTIFSSIMFAILFFLAIGIAVGVNKIPMWIAVLYFTASLVTFVMYAIDKSAAQNGRWRTQESTLHLLSLMGGWPGALIAQAKLRHKSKKLSFRAVYWLTVIINCGIFIWLLSPEGALILKSF